MQPEVDAVQSTLAWLFLLESSKTLQDNLADCQSNLETERDTVARLESELDASRQELNRLKEQLERVQCQADEQRDTNEHRIAESRATLEEMAVAMAEKEALIGNLTAEIKQTSNQLAVVIATMASSATDS